MYRGQHRKDMSRSGRTGRALVVVAFVCLVSMGALLPDAALGLARPKECTGSAPTAITIVEHFTGPVGTPAVTFTYQIERDGSVVATTTLTVAPNETASTTVGGLGPGSYTVYDHPEPGVIPLPASASAVVDPPACAPVVTFESLLPPE